MHRIMIFILHKQELNVKLWNGLILSDSFPCLCRWRIFVFDRCRRGGVAVARCFLSDRIRRGLKMAESISGKKLV